MSTDYPYQIVTFLDKEPLVGEPVYYGTRGWYPQLALKRRFRLRGIDEDELVQRLADFFAAQGAIDIETRGLIRPERMPVQVIDITNQAELKTLHESLVASLGEVIASRFPERDGNNYYPHITAEHNNELVIPAEEYSFKHFAPTNVWLLKDIDDANSKAYIKIK